MNHDATSVNSIKDDLEDDKQVDDDLIADVIDLEAQKRLWVRAMIPLLQHRSRDSDPSSRVQLAIDLMHIAACERVSRILRSDLPDNQS